MEKKNSIILSPGGKFLIVNEDDGLSGAIK